MKEALIGLTVLSTTCLLLITLVQMTPNESERIIIKRLESINDFNQTVIKSATAKDLTISTEK